MFVHPKVPIEQGTEELQHKMALEEYQASMNHYFQEEVYLKKLNHPNIVKVHESQRSVAINIPSYLKTDENLSDKN